MIYISRPSDLQLGKLKENFLATQAFANPENISEPQTGIELTGFAKAWVAKTFSFNLPSCKSLDIYLILDIYRHIETAELGVCMSLTNQDISQPSLCHLSLGSSMVRASHRRSEGCGFNSRLGLRNIFWVCESLSSQKVFLYMICLR